MIVDENQNFKKIISAYKKLDKEFPPKEKVVYPGDKEWEDLSKISEVK
jgi:hypothetical protein